MKNVVSLLVRSIVALDIKFCEEDFVWKNSMSEQGRKIAGWDVLDVEGAPFDMYSVFKNA